MPASIHLKIQRGKEMTDEVELVVDFRLFGKDGMVIFGWRLRFMTWIRECRSNSWGIEGWEVLCVPTMR